MALIITENGEAKLRISGTNTDLGSMYSRISFDCSLSGKEMRAVVNSYSTKAEYEANAGSLLLIDKLPNQFYVDVIPPAVQSLQTVHEGVKAELETLGYTVEIVDL